MPDFSLDKRIAASTVYALDLTVSRVLVMDDARYPWLILVPRRAHLTELFELSPTDRILLTEEVAIAAERLKDLTGCHKINIGSLGNIVPQLHFHIVARNIADPAWPGPVWGAGEAIPYEPKALEAFVHAVVHMF